MRAGVGVEITFVKHCLRNIRRRIGYLRFLNYYNFWLQSTKREIVDLKFIRVGTIDGLYDLDFIHTGIVDEMPEGKLIRVGTV